MATLVTKDEKRVKAIVALFQKVQKAISKEFLWILAIVIISFPVTLLLLFVLDIIAPGISAELEAEGIDIVDLALVLYVISGLGIYFIRMVVGAIAVLAKKQP